MIKSRGVTLIEFMISLILLSVVGTAAVLIFKTILLSWSAQTERIGVDLPLDRAVVEMVRDLREAKQVQSTSGYREIRYTRDGSTYYILYLYSAPDAYASPPAFNQSSYQLRRAALAGGIGGTFTYGSGTLMVTNVLPPPTTDLSLSGSLIVLDVSAKQGDETLRVKTQVVPRNL